MLYRFSDSFMASEKADERRFPEAVQDLPVDYVHEHYRHKLRIMQYRLNLNLSAVDERMAQPDIDPSGQTTGYANEREFLDDLQLVYDSLVAGGDRNLADAGLKDLIRLVQTFGFYLMHLDIRQESTRHTSAVSEILKTLPDAIDYASLDETARQQQLTRALATTPPPLDRPALSEDTRETLEVFAVMRSMQTEVSAHAFGNYVISMTHTASHILEVMYLAWRSCTWPG
jgi:phosphoenolpyruvate carboxylase